MPAEFHAQTVTIPGGSGRKTVADSVTFSSPIVGSSGVAVNGFNLDYSGNDRRMAGIEVNADRIAAAGNVLTFEVNCNLRDDSGNDSYSGSVTVLAMAEV